MELLQETREERRLTDIVIEYLMRMVWGTIVLVFAGVIVYIFAKPLLVLVLLALALYLFAQILGLLYETGLFERLRAREYFRRLKAERRTRLTRMLWYLFVASLICVLVWFIIVLAV